MVATVTTDAALIRSVITHPAVWAFVSDDMSGTPDDYEPPITDGIHWVAIRDGDELAALFLFHPWNGITYEVHTCILPKWRGAKSREATAAAMAWIFTHSPCQKIVTQVATENAPALRLATDSGMTLEGMNTQSILRNNTLHDQHILGITRAEWEKCQQQR